MPHSIAARWAAESISGPPPACSVSSCTSSFAQRANRGSDCVGNVVQFEIEEELKLAPPQLPDDIGAGGVEQLHPNLEPATAAFEPVHHGQSVTPAGQIERDDQAVVARVARAKARLLVTTLRKDGFCWDARSHRELAAE